MMIKQNVLYDDEYLQAPIEGKECGENRWIPIENVLEIYIETGCTVETEAEDSVWGMVEIKWTFDEFFNAEGRSSFVDRFTSVLGIHSSRLKVVGLVEGSVIVEYFILKN